MQVMSTLQSSKSDPALPDSQVAEQVKVKTTMPVSQIESKDSVDSGSESMGLSDTDNDIGTNIKETLLCIKALNGEADELSMSNEKSGTNGLENTVKKTLSDTGSDEEYSSDGLKILKTNIENCISSLAEESDKNGSNSDVGTTKTEDSNLFDEALNNEDESILDKISSDDNLSEKGDTEDSDKALDEDKLLSEDSSDKPYDDQVSSEKLLQADDDSYDKLLNDGDQESDKVNDDDQVSSNKLVNNVDEHNEGSMEVDMNDNESQNDVLDENEDESLAQHKIDNEDDDLILLPDANSPLSDCSLNNSSSKQLGEDENLSESKLSECDSSLSSSLHLSKKHPLLIGKNVKCSFKGIMKTAVSRVSLDSDSSKSSSPKPDMCKSSSPLPDLACSSSGNKSPCVTDTVADSSTMPDNRNLFDKLTSLSDLEVESEPKEYGELNTTCISQSDDKVTDMEMDDITRRPDTPSDSREEPMDTETVPDDGDDDVAEADLDGAEKSLTSEVSAAVITEESKDNEDSKDASLSADDQKLTESEEVSQDSVSKESCENFENAQTSSDSAAETSRSQTPVSISNQTTKTKCVAEPSASKPKPDNCKTEVLDVKIDNCDITSSGNNSLAKTASCKSEESTLLEDVKVIDTAVKAEVKDENPEEKSESLDSKDGIVDSTIDSLSKAAGDGERKRSANEDSEESQPKRSRLDLVIGKLGSQIGISPENMKCDETMFDSDVDESCKESSESTETRSEDVTSEEDENTPGSPRKSRKLSEEVLEVLIKQKIRDLLDQQKAELTKQFQAKIDELNTSNEGWKSQAKELQRRAAELISHQQRQERRRAVRIGGQRRNVGIQVGEERINSATTKPPGTPPRSSSSVVTIPAITTNVPSGGKPIIQETGLPGKMKETGQTVKSILENNRAVVKMASSTPLSAGTQTSAATSTATQSQGGGSSLVKIIDLTADEESTCTKSSTIGTSRPVPGQSLLTSQVRQVGSVQQPVQPGTRILLSSSTGTQFVSPANFSTAQPRTSGVQYQYLYAAGSQNVRPGSVVTLVQQNPNGTATGLRQVVTSASSTGPPQLTRPAQQVINNKSQVASTLRSPPPLLSAPKTMTASSITKLSTANLPLPPPPPVVKPEVPKHPAALPAPPTNQNLNPALKPLPPKPGLKISRVSQGIVLSWNMTTSETHADIVSYQLFAYQEGHLPPNTSLWKKVGDVKALPLPMACTLTQFQEGNKYHFAVRAVDTHGRVGLFSDASTIHLVSQTGK